MRIPSSCAPPTSAVTVPLMVAAKAEIEEKQANKNRQTIRVTIRISTPQILFYLLNLNTSLFRTASNSSADHGWGK